MASPSIGRFLQRDPMQGGSLNPYEYAQGDPLNNEDHTGRLSTGKWVGLALTVLLGIVVASASGPAAPATAFSLNGLAKAMAVGAAVGAARSAVINVVEQAIDYGMSNFKLDSFGLAVGFGAGVGALMGGAKFAYAARGVAPPDIFANDQPDLFWDLMSPSEQALAEASGFGEAWWPTSGLAAAGTASKLGEAFMLGLKTVPLSLAKWGVGYTVKTAIAGGLSKPASPSVAGGAQTVDAGSSPRVLLDMAATG